MIGNFMAGSSDRKLPDGSSTNHNFHPVSSSSSSSRSWRHAACQTDPARSSARCRPPAALAASWLIRELRSGGEGGAGGKGASCMTGKAVGRDGGEVEGSAAESARMEKWTPKRRLERNDEKGNV